MMSGTYEAMRETRPPSREVKTMDKTYQMYSYVRTSGLNWYTCDAAERLLSEKRA